MPLYICRWQNGNFSAVSAATREKAIDLLGEFGDTGRCEVFAAKNLHFRLKRDAKDMEEAVPIELVGLGGCSRDKMRDRVYTVTHSLPAMEVQRNVGLLSHRSPKAYSPR